MAEIEHDTGFMSIGEVLSLLQQEFPDVTISKIRFLESQGLISPERTASGYRKFYQEDIDLLRVILTEQKQNFLPLRVIRNRLETGEIDPTGEHLKFADDELPPETPTDGIDRPGEMSRPSLANEPVEVVDVGDDELISEADFCRLSSLNEEELRQLLDFGVLAPEAGGYTAADLRIAKPAGEFLRQGIDARHLRLWRTGAEREASLFEQIVQPRFRQRNPEATARAVAQLELLNALGAELRNALMDQYLHERLDY